MMFVTDDSNIVIDSLGSGVQTLDSRALPQALTATEAETEAGGRSGSRRLLSAAPPLACTTKAIIIFCLRHKRLFVSAFAFVVI